jgi:hypothetical protein
MVFEVLFFGNPTLNLSYPNSATPLSFSAPNLINAPQFATESNTKF